jgi:hypothetical protein
MKEKREEEKQANREGTTDLPYLMFKLSHARASLTYALFAAAIFASSLTYWEFLKYVIYHWLPNVLAIIIVISVSVGLAVDAIRNYHKYKKERKKRLGY